MTRHFRCSLVGSNRSVTLYLAALVGALVAAPPAHADLTDLFKSPTLAGLELEPLGPALANTVAGTYPVSSASSSVTYVFNPQLEAFERRTRVLGPLFGERAETVGEGQIDVGVSYSNVTLETVNGEDLHSLINQPQVNGRVVSFPIKDGVTLKDGRFSNFLPVLVNANISVDADIWAPSFTYGLTPYWDINLMVPIVSSFLGVKTNQNVPDPRLPQFMLNPGDPNEQFIHTDQGDRATGIGDVLLRTKYHVWREAPANAAVLLGLSCPSGNKDNFHGRGTWRVQPTFIVSKILDDRVEPFLNAGFDINAENVDRTIFTWAAGASVQVRGPLNASMLVLGRNEFARQTDKIESPFFFQIDRNDMYDFSFGLRWLFADSGVVSANVILPMNTDGLRPEVIPSFGVEYAFSTPAL